MALLFQGNTEDVGEDYNVEAADDAPRPFQVRNVCWERCSSCSCRLCQMPVPYIWLPRPLRAMRPASAEA